MTFRTVAVAIAVLVLVGSLIARGAPITVVKEPTKEPAVNSPLDLKVKDINVSVPPTAPFFPRCRLS
jgi:hypothetical protein